MGDHYCTSRLLDKQRDSLETAKNHHHNSILLIWNGKLICNLIYGYEKIWLSDMCEKASFIYPPFSCFICRPYRQQAGSNLQKNWGDAYYLSTWLSSYKCSHKVTVSSFLIMMLKKWHLCGSKCRKKYGKCFSLKALLLRDAV